MVVEHFLQWGLGAVAPEQPLVPTGVKSPSVSLEEERPLKQQIDGGSSSVLVFPLDRGPYRFQQGLRHLLVLAS